MSDSKAKQALTAELRSRGLEPRDWYVADGQLCCQAYKDGKHFGGASAELPKPDDAGVAA